MYSSIVLTYKDWDERDLQNLCSLLGIKISSSLVDIEYRIKWLYHSKTRATLESSTKNVFKRILGKIQQKNLKRSLVSDDVRQAPSYDSLIYEACKVLSAYEHGFSLADHEIFLCQAIIIKALEKMKPGERKQFFEREIDTREVMRQGEIKGVSLQGPIATFAALGLAQVSGFGVYMLSTTALGFLTHAIGVTLPFVVYTGMTSTIAFLIGPVGWLSAGLWGAWKLTQPSWKRLIPALVYIIATNSKRSLELHP